jgi:hypothetical protein
MKFKIKTKQESNCKKRKFCIYHHELTMDELDEYILKIMFDSNKLNYLFEPNTSLKVNNRKRQLSGFIEGSFKNRENEVRDIDIKNAIEANTNPSYYAFFAEALLARLNIDYLDEKLISGVLTYSTRITEGRTGADVCMFSDKNLVLGEAKFYGELSGGLKSIIEDNTFLSKLESFCNNIVDSEDEIVLKGINGDVRNKTFDEIEKNTVILSGFILHTKSIQGNYDTHYNKIDNITIKKFPKHFQIHLYHLPINSKNELIFKAQKRAIDLIIGLNN